MALRYRLKRLEDCHGGTAGGVFPPQKNRRLWERYFHAHENARRELYGLEPLPDLPYTEEDRQDDRRCLQETIPAYREVWHTEEGQAFLNTWEQDIKTRLEKGA